MFGKKKIEEMQKDPKKAIEEADKKLNKGFTGFMTKSFMGKGFVEKMNEGLDTAKQAMDYGNIAQTGQAATAEVLSIEDTGKMVNFNPVVKLGLNVQPQYGIAFKNVAEVMVSKIAVPRVGDKLNIKYNPADPTQIVIV